MNKKAKSFLMPILRFAFGDIFVFEKQFGFAPTQLHKSN